MLSHTTHKRLKVRLHHLKWFLDAAKSRETARRLNRRCGALEHELAIARRAVRRLSQNLRRLSQSNRELSKRSYCADVDAAAIKFSYQIALSVMIGAILVLVARLWW
jgi:hypothetical protein